MEVVLWIDQPKKRNKESVEKNIIDSSSITPKSSL